jgi:hypothetical protein
MSPGSASEQVSLTLEISDHTHDIDVGVSLKHSDIVPFAHAFERSHEPAKTGSNNKDIDPRRLIGAHWL